MNILLNLYIVGYILCDRHLLLMHSMRFLHLLIRSLGLYHTPSWNTLPLFNQLVFKSGKCGSWREVQSCIHMPRIPQGWPIGDGSGPGRPVKEVCHDQLANRSLPYYRYTGTVSLEEKIVSTSLIHLQDMWVKDFIYIALVCKWPPNYYAN